MFRRFRDVGERIGDDLEETRSRARWESRGFYFFRRLLQYSAAALLLTPVAWWICFWTQTWLWLFLVAFGLELGGCVIGLVGMCLTARTSKKERQP